MIFQPSTDIDSRLAKEVARVEQRESGVRVVAARMYRVPFVSMKARVTIQKERAFNVLEEFILRAALELQPAWTRTQIAGLLGLDVIFLNFTCDDLVRRGLLEAELSETVILTPEGKTAWERGSVPEPPEELLVDLVFDFGSMSLRRIDSLKPWSGDDPVLIVGDGATLEESARNAITVENVTGVRPDLHAPREGRLVVAVAPDKVESIEHYCCGVMIGRDTLAADDAGKDIVLRVVDLGGRLRNDLEKLIDGMLVTGKMRLSDLLPNVVDETALPAPASVGEATPHVDLVRQSYRELAGAVQSSRQAGEGSQQSKGDGSEQRKSTGTIVLLRDHEIRPRFLQEIQSTKRSLIIVSPWMNEGVLDKEFRGYLADIAKRGATTLLGWGIARDPTLEDKAPSQALLDGLGEIVDPSGAPAVIVWWLGNQHTKEVLVDGETHLLGSHNWMSYRGDRFWRGESTYVVTVPETVAKASNHVSGLFSAAARAGWQACMSSEHQQGDGLERSLLTWLTCRNPAIAFERMLEYANDAAAKTKRTVDLLRAVNDWLVRLTSAEVVDMNIVGLTRGFLNNFLKPVETGAPRVFCFPAMEKSLKHLASIDSSGLASFLEQNRDSLVKVGWLTLLQGVEDLLNEWSKERKQQAKAEKPKKNNP